MNKKMVIIIAAIFIFPGFMAYLLISNKMLVRLPVLVREKPRMTFVLGHANFRENSGKQWETAEVGTELNNGYEVQTLVDSVVDIRFHEGMVIRLTGKSELKIDDVTIKNLLLTVKIGSLFGKFEKLHKDRDRSETHPGCGVWCEHAYCEQQVGKGEETESEG